ncbi:MAG: hypothetical protein ABI182_02020 [Candidatus Baltobacteraceae bacterium]
MSLFADASPLRPLGLGEIFDRAITVYVRNFLAFSAILLVVLIPLSLAQYLSVAQQHQSGSLTQIVAQIEHPPKPGSKTAAPVAPFSPWAVLSVVVSLFLSPFANVAVALGVARVYFGKTVDWRACYSAVLRRWPSMLLLTLFEIGTFIGWVFGAVISLGLMGVLGVFTFLAVPFLGVIVFIVAGILFLAWMISLMLVVLAIFFAFNALVIEELGLGAAFRSGFSRIFARPEIGKATVVGLCLLAIQFGIVMVVMGIELLVLSSTKTAGLSVLFSSLISLISSAFIGILIAVYYFDVRVRREGLDMQTSLQLIASDAPVPA